MAKLERTLTGDFDDILWRLDQAVLNGSMSATLEDRSDFSIGPVQVSVRMYERYSALGGNRVAMCVTLAGEGDRLHLTAITAGGSQAMLFKMNTFGEEAFLDTLARVADTL